MKFLKLALFCLIGFVASCCKNYRVENLTTEFAAGERGKELKDVNLSEISGVAASRNNPGKLWVHNDSGGQPELYLIDDSLTIHGVVQLKGVVNRDWEDIAVANSPAGPVIYLGEIGDNEGKFEVKTIWIFHEPTVNTTRCDTIVVEPQRMNFRMPGKARDAEALMVHPKTGEIFVISKREERVKLYSLGTASTGSDTLLAKELVELPLTQIVAADISPDGSEVLMKNYGHIYYWQVRGRESMEAALSRRPNEVLYKIEPQGESIAWSAKGDGFYTLSEMNPAKSVYLYYYPKRRK